MSTLADEFAAFARSRGLTVRQGPAPRKPESCPQAPGEGYPQALTCRSALAPSRPHAPAHAPAGTRESAREAPGESPPSIGRSQPLQSPPKADPWLEYTDDYSVWKQGQ